MKIIEEHYQFGNFGRAVICNRPAIGSPSGFRVSFKGEPIIGSTFECVADAREFLHEFMFAYLAVKKHEADEAYTKAGSLQLKLTDRSKLRDFKTL